MSRMRISLKILKILSLLLLLAWSFSPKGFSQEEKDEEDSREIVTVGPEELADTVGKSFKKAVEEVDMEKSIRKAKEKEEINAKLDTFIQEWIDSQRSERKSEINSIIEQDWQNLLTTPPQHLNYYLRDFLYTVEDKDIREAASITYPYRATVGVRELLYVERAPLVAKPRSKYQYTADTVFRITLQYNKDRGKWNMVNIQDVYVNLKKGWPPQIKKKLSSYFIPAK